MLILFAKVTSTLWDEPRYLAGYDVSDIRCSLPLLPSNAASCPDEVKVDIELVNHIDIPANATLYSVGLKCEDMEFVNNRNKNNSDYAIANYVIEEFDDEFY